jgi:hypothetical protein
LTANYYFFLIDDQQSTALPQTSAWPGRAGGRPRSSTIISAAAIRGETAFPQRRPGRKIRRKLPSFSPLIVMRQPPFNLGGTNNALTTALKVADSEPVLVVRTMIKLESQALLPPLNRPARPDAGPKPAADLAVGRSRVAEGRQTAKKADGWLQQFASAKEPAARSAPDRR